MTLIEPGSDTWKMKISPSKGGAILGVSPNDSPVSMWNLMAGITTKEEQTKRQSRGHYLEPAILAWFFDQHPEFEWVDTKHTTFEHATLGWIANLDAEAVHRETCEKHNVEAKSDADFAGQWGTPGTDEIPPHYVAQAMISMHITGHRRTYFPMITAGLEFREYVVDYDEQWATEVMEPALLAFEASLKTGVRPPLDSHVATYESLKRAHPDIEDSYVVLNSDVALEYVESRDAAKVANERAALARNHVLDAMNVARYAECAGVRVGRRQGTRGAPAYYDTRATREDLLKALERSEVA